MSLLTTTTTTTTSTASTAASQTPSDDAMSLRQRHHQAELVQHYALTELGPALRGSAHAHAHAHARAVSSALAHSAQRLLRVHRLALTYLLLGCNVFALRALLAARDLALALRGLAWAAWDSRPGRRLRRKLEFELFVLILGCGNGFCLVVFWPGWVLVGLAYLVYLVWSWAG